MFPWTAFKDADRQLKEALCESGRHNKYPANLYFDGINKVKLALALDAGAEPDLCVDWINTAQGGTWKIPALVATTLQSLFSSVDGPQFDAEAADLLLGAGADPYQRWKGRSHGLGWSFAEWVYETGSAEGFALLNKHRVDLSPLFSGRRFQQDPVYGLGMFEAGQAVQANMEGYVKSQKDASFLDGATATNLSERKSPRL